MTDVLGDRIEMVAWQSRYTIPYAAHVTHVCMPRLKGELMFQKWRWETNQNFAFAATVNRQPSTVNQSTRRQSRVNEDLH